MITPIAISVGMYLFFLAFLSPAGFLAGLAAFFLSSSAPSAAAASSSI
jgi:hypothetical protein